LSINFLVVAMGLYYLIYQSRAVVPFTDDELAMLLQQARTHNRQVHVTGLLLHTSDGRFLQILEGDEADVRQLYHENILADPRHYQCLVLGEGSCAERSFADWNMGFRLASAADLHDLLQSSSLNPPRPQGPRPTIRPELMERLLDFVEIKAAY
jgi:hypothetical protein